MFGAHLSPLFVSSFSWVTTSFSDLSEIRDILTVHTRMHFYDTASLQFYHTESDLAENDPTNLPSKSPSVDGASTVSGSDQILLSRPPSYFRLSTVSEALVDAADGELPPTLGNFSTIPNLARGKTIKMRSTPISYTTTAQL